MPWKASSVMEERLRFVARLLDGEAMTDVCRDFGVSRKTGYKIFDRYKEHGLEALSDRSRRPVRYANQLPQPLESLIVRLKGEKPHWGARKIRELLLRRLDGDVRVPAKSTVHAVLDRHGLVKRGGGPRHRGMSGVCVRDFCEGGFPFWCIETEASTARLPTLLGRTERSSPEAAQRRAAGAGLDGDGACQAIIDSAMMSVIGISVWSPESARRTGWQTGPWPRSIQRIAASAGQPS